MNSAARILMTCAGLLLAGCATGPETTMEPAGPETKPDTPAIRTTNRFTSNRPVAEPPVAVQAFTFRKYTFLETLDRAQALGLRYVEMYPGQPIGRPPRTWQCRWKTDCPAASPLLMTRR